MLLQVEVSHLMKLKSLACLSDKHENKQPSKLSRKDFKYLMNLLDKAEEEVGAGTEAGGDKRASALTRRRIMRIRLALIDLNK